MYVPLGLYLVTTLPTVMRNLSRGCVLFSMKTLNKLITKFAPVLFLSFVAKRKMILMKIIDTQW